jgi:puromycin-sensitive aminopeptidase
MKMCISHVDEAVQVSGSRLPRNVVPLHYRLRFEPFFSTYTFAGDETVDIKVLEPTSSIVINAAELKISNVVLSTASGRSFKAEVTFDEENEFAIFTFPTTIKKGRYKLSLKFRGVLNGKLHGFYRTLYKGVDGKKKVIASTQMEPADARRAFPSFDEPDRKAEFSISIIADPSLTALSNGLPYRSRLLPNGKKLTTFEKSPLMATYVTGMVVGAFAKSKTVVVNGVKVTVYCTPGKEGLTDFALEAAQYTIKWCEEFFKIKYPGKKLDLVGIPEFAFGAMENWNLNIFRETALLVDPKTATIAEMMQVFITVAHEIVHTWFGNLVTMKWWNGLWLNEAFATFISMKVAAHAHPEWHVFEDFAAGRRAGAMRTDGLMTTRPIQAEVEKASEALGMVDGITYGKGSGVLWQLEQFIGDDVFRDGVRVYLQKHLYGNTVNDDLWSAIGSQTKAPVEEMMKSWIFQPGHPVVTVGSCDCGSGGRLKLNQRRFFYGEPAEEGTKSAMVCSSPSADIDWSNAGRWMVPIKLRYESEDGVKEKWVMLDSKEKSIYLGNDVKWVLANSGGSGFYRTRYETALTSKVAISELSIGERYNLVSDTWACVRAGLVSSTDYHDVIKEFANETDPNVMGVIIGSMGTLLDVLPKANRESFRTFIRELLTPTLARLGWQEQPGESVQDKQLRGKVIDTLGCTARDQAVADQGKALFRQYLVDKSVVPNNVAPSLVWITAASGDEAQYEEFLRFYNTTQNPQEKVRYLYALAYFDDENLLRRTLAASITDVVKKQDAHNVLATLLDSDIQEEAWAFVQKNWDILVGRLSETGMISLVGSFSALSEPHLEQQVRDFIATHPVRGGNKQVAQMLENLRINVSFREREIERLTARFGITEAAV